MKKSLKTIIIVVVLLGVAVLLIFRGDLVGQAFAALASSFAVFKSKLFNSSKTNVEEEIGNIELEHTAKRNDWSLMKEEYDSKFNALKARMDYLDYKSATLSKKIGELNESEKTAIKKNSNLSDEELLNWLKN